MVTLASNTGLCIEGSIHMTQVKANTGLEVLFKVLGLEEHIKV